MRSCLAIVLALACAVPLGPAAATQLRHRGRPDHAGRIASRTRGANPARVGPIATGFYHRGGGFNAGAAQVPPPGFYNGYDGPGATVLRRGVAAQYEPGATEEIAPDAKQTATGGPVGGLPGSSGP